MHQIEKNFVAAVVVVVAVVEVCLRPDRVCCVSEEQSAVYWRPERSATMPTTTTCDLESPF